MQYGGDDVKRMLMALVAQGQPMQPMAQGQPVQAGYTPQGQMDADLQGYADGLDRQRAILDHQRQMQMMGLHRGPYTGNDQMQPLEPSRRFEMFGARSPMERGA